MCEKEVRSSMKKLFSSVNNCCFGKNETEDDRNDGNAGYIMIVNEDDHPILFEIYDEHKYNKKQWIQPNNKITVEFDPKISFIWLCKAWFNGVQNEPMIFNVWEGKNIKLMIRKDDGIYKADLDGKNEKVHIKFCGLV